MLGFPGGPLFKNLSYKRHRFDPWSGKIPHAAEQLSLCPSTAVPTQWPKKGEGEPSSQVNFSTQYGWRKQIHRRVEVEGKDLERMGGIFMTYLRTG